MKCFLLLFAIIMVVAALAQQTPKSSPDWRTISEITIDRQGCFGSCPVYSLTLRRDGNSTYVGKRSAQRIGRYTAKQAFVGDFRQLCKAISDLGFFGLRGEYGTEVEDAEHVVVTVISGSQTKTVKTFNFAGAPFELWSVVTLVDGVGTNLPWEMQ